MRDTLSAETISAKVSLLADSGIDMAAFHTLEYEIHVDGEVALKDIRAELTHAAPSTYTKSMVLHDANVHSLRMRVRCNLFDKYMDITIFWINDLESRHDEFISNLRVVLKSQ